MPLEFVVNTLDDATHVELDLEMLNLKLTQRLQKLPVLQPSDCALLLVAIASRSNGCIDKKFTDYGEAEDLMQESEDLQIALAEALDAKSFRSIRNLKILRQPQVEAEPIRPLFADQEKATEDSWERTFVGQAAEALWMHVKKYHAPDNFNVYAHYVAIVQSSGMGKSRTVDELGKKHFSIPINLREVNSTGYPPPDHAVRDFLTKKVSESESHLRACCFIEALFDHTLVTLRGNHFEADWEIRQVAVKFRSLMTIGQSMKGHNEFRTRFYDEVIRLAEEKLRAPKNDTYRSETKDSSVYSSPSHSNNNEYNFTPSVACRKLEEALHAREHQASPTLVTKTLGSKTRSQAQKIPSTKENDPLIILAFDEAHTLTARVVTDSGAWSNFSALRHVLRALHRFSLFSLFLSTTGKISQFTSAPDEDVSKRILAGELFLIQPFTDLGFDTLAEKISVADLNLAAFIGDSHIVHIGRPLFASRYDAGDLSVKEDIIKFAAGKLLNADLPIKELTRDQALACLAQRMPIEFNSTNYIAQASERKQVEGHMRVCLKIDAAFESMVTVSASEPILAEAAYFVMAQNFFNAPVHFKSVLEGFAVHKGERGEFVTILLLTLARDAAVGPPGSDGRPKNSRAFDVASFMCGHLFRRSIKPEYFDFDSREALGRLQEDFPRAVMHFNHFIKLHDFKSIDKESLLLRMSRGAGILCANNHSHIDVINVFLRSGTKLGIDNFGLVLYQIKNDSHYTHIPKLELFSGMDPYELRILKPEDPPVPVIRIFFALAARTPCLNVTRHDPAMDKNYKAVTYDIWCAGLSPEVLSPIDAPYAHIWGTLLQASYGWQELYKADTDEERNLRRSMNPGAASDDGHWSRWVF